MLRKKTPLSSAGCWVRYQQRWVSTEKVKTIWLQLIKHLYVFSFFMGDISRWWRNGAAGPLRGPSSSSFPLESMKRHIYCRWEERRGSRMRVQCSWVRWGEERGGHESTIQEKQGSRGWKGTVRTPKKLWNTERLRAVIEWRGEKGNMRVNSRREGC